MEGGGIKTYLSNIISSFKDLDQQPIITLICSKSSKPVFQNVLGYDNYHLISIPISSKFNLIRIFLDQVVVPIILFLKFGKSNEVLVTPSSIATILCPIRQITIIQAPLVLKNLRDELNADLLKDLTSIKKLYYDIFLPKTVRKSQEIITVSKFLKDKLVDLHPEATHKTEVVYEGVDAEPFRFTPIQENNYQSEILFVSTLYSYKNADRVIQAFALAVSENKVPESMILRIIGNDPSGGSRLEELRQLAKECLIESRVEFDGYVPHEIIYKYYGKAKLFIFPSSVETFGLPPLEAMASGVPVIASNRMSVPEIVGDAGLIIDPDDIDSIVEAINSIINDQKLKEKLIRKGKDRVSSFQWKKSVTKITDIAKEMDSLF
jgi:glycosyltransferase involved in cell wall biosynthesis